MNDSDFLKSLDRASNFHIRRTMERLREGLFDSLGVQLLTAGETHMSRVFDQGAKAVDKNRRVHLCVCGTYGQGKSHSLTYIRQRALSQGFVTSHINLDPKESPFHELPRVYQALVTRIQFPGQETSLAEQWKSWAEQTIADGPEQEDEPEPEISTNEQKASRLLDILPDEMPHFFKTVLTALALETIPLSKDEMRLRKHAAYHPHEFPYLLDHALTGEIMTILRLRPAFKYREVSFYKDAPLVCKGWEPYLMMIFSLSSLFRQMGFRGWVLLFDEGESIAQARINSRNKSYQILHRMFVPETPVFGLYPVFAFTDDFFMRLQREDYERIRVWKGEESPYFERNYAEAWGKLTIFRLKGLSPKEWIDLSVKLMMIHARAYHWDPPETQAYEAMTRRLGETRDQESRLKIKALVDQLDLLHQRQVLG